MAQALLGRGVLERGTLQAVAREHAWSGGSWAKAAVSGGFVTDEQFTELAVDVSGLERIRFGDTRMDLEVAQAAGERWSTIHEILPVYAPDARTVVVAIVDPDEVTALDELGLRLSRRTQARVTSRADFDRFMGAAFRGEPPPRPLTPEEIEERSLLVQAIRANREAAATLRAVFELCIERGLVTERELQARMARMSAERR